MQRVRTYLRGSVLVLVLAPALGAAQEIPKNINSSVRWAENRESRRAQAVEWLAEVANIEKQIPTLSPAEEAWLKVEYDEEIKREGTLTARATRAMFSKEGAARSAKPVAQSMVSILESLASSSDLSEANEALLWTSLAYLVLDWNFWGDIARLGEYGIIARSPQSKHTTGEYREFLHEMWASRVQDILHRIVLPHLSVPVRR